MSRSQSWLGRLAVVACLGMIAGCQSLPAADESLATPEIATFPLVSDALERRCATLDCHGSIGRNLRLYTGTGLRLAAADVPGSGATTDLEYKASYRSMVSLEPEILDAVVSAGGDRPERLTLVRKGRDSEHHKGGAILVEGDAADRCLTSWLATAIDEEACAAAADYLPPAGWDEEPPP